MNKGLIIGGLVVMVLLVLVGLNKNTESDQSAAIGASEQKKLVTLSTFTIIADIVSEVGGDKIESVSLTRLGAEIHGYETSPNDLVRASKADVLFENGMNLELWTAKLRTSLPKMPSVIVSEGVEMLSIGEGAYEGKPNPHAWMSPKQGLVYVENIRKALIELDPKNAETFNANAESYSNKLRAVDTRLAKALSVLPENNRYLVTCEGAFTYLTSDYGLNEIYLWPINSESQGSPQQIARVIDIVKEKNIPAVFCESTIDPKVQREVVKATGAKMGGVLYVDSLSLAGGPAPTYLALLEATADTIITGLTGE